MRTKIQVLLPDIAWYHMVKSKFITVHLLWLLVISPLVSQNSASERKHDGLSFITEIGYLSGTGNVIIDQVDVSNEGLGGRLRFIISHRISNHFSGGLGFGLDGYHEPSYSTFPIFMDVRGHLKDAKSTPFALINLGYALEITDHFEKGPFSNFGVGYKVFFGFTGQRVHFLPSVGFNLQQIHRERQIIDTSQFPPLLDTVKDNFTVKSFTINLGVQF